MRNKEERRQFFKPPCRPLSLRKRRAYTHVDSASKAEMRWDFSTRALRFLNACQGKRESSAVVQQTDRGRAVGHAELPQDRGDVSPHRDARDEEALGDLGGVP